MIITFCGHSNYIKNCKDEEILLNLLEKTIQGKQVDFYLGGYGNFDAFALECAKKYKQRHLNANLIFVTPYINNWLEERKDILQKSYDMVIYPELENVPLKFAIIKRNEWMVSKADYVFAYVNISFGGAYNTLLYAHNHNKPYTNLYKGNLKL